MYPTQWSSTLKLWLFTFSKIPMLFWLRPRIAVMSASNAVICIKFGRRTRNHVNSMYFGALCAGADLTVGLLAMHLFEVHGFPARLVFKTINADFIKRCEGHAYFLCDEGALIAAAIQKAKETHERQNILVNARAVVMTPQGEEVVAVFKMGLSFKGKGD